MKMTIRKIPKPLNPPLLVSCLILPNRAAHSTFCHAFFSFFFRIHVRDRTQVTLLALPSGNHKIMLVRVLGANNNANLWNGQVRTRCTIHAFNHQDTRPKLVLNSLESRLPQRPPSVLLSAGCCCCVRRVRKIGSRLSCKWIRIRRNVEGGAEGGRLILCGPDQKIEKSKTIGQI